MEAEAKSELEIKMNERLNKILEEIRARKRERDEAKRQELEKEMIPKFEQLCEKLEKYFINSSETRLNVPQEEIPLLLLQRLREIGFLVVSRYDSKGPSYDITI